QRDPSQPAAHLEEYPPLWTLAPGNTASPTSPGQKPILSPHEEEQPIEGAQSNSDPAEEMIRLMKDVKRLDEDVLDGLVRGVKIPAPSLANPPAVKEILFPANLICLVTNEMWKYGLLPESERFLANVLQTIQDHVMSFTGEEAIVPGIFWLSNVHEMLSHDLDSMESNIYNKWMLETKKKLSKMVVPALIKSQAIPGFKTSDGGGRLCNLLWIPNSAWAYSMDDILNMLNKVWASLRCYHMEESVVQQVMTELLKLIGVTGLNDLLMRRNFSSWKRAMQIQYNVTRIEEWCKSHDMPEGTLQLGHLMQATKVLQSKKATAADIDIIGDVCWMLTPMQIQRLLTNYHVADYDSLLLSPETEDVGPYELPLPRQVSGLETYVPAYLNVSHLRRIALLV
ncbi:class V myosin, partial [Mycena vulgaris]